MSRRKTHEEYVDEVYNMVGNEYAIITKYSTAKDKVVIKHNVCGYMWDTLPFAVLRGHRCPICSVKKRTRTNDGYKTDLQRVTDTIINIEPYVAINVKVKHKCLTCNGVWDGYPGRLLKGVGCPICACKLIVTGINDLATTHPHIAKLLKHPEDGLKVSKGVGEKLLFKCDNCGTEKYMRVRKVVVDGFICPSCSDGISYNNKIVYNLIKQIGVECVPEKCFS